jgi:hypothetical protein
MRDWAPSYAERRRIKRHPANKRVILIVQNGLRRGCSVFDLSPLGARLELGAPYPLPRRLELLFTNGQRVKAHLVWQREVMAGVFFDTPLGFFERLLCELSLPRDG